MTPPPYQRKLLYSSYVFWFNSITQFPVMSCDDPWSSCGSGAFKIGSFHCVVMMNSWSEQRWFLHRISLFFFVCVYYSAFNVSLTFPIHIHDVHVVYVLFINSSQVDN